MPVVVVVCKQREDVNIPCAVITHRTSLNPSSAAPPAARPQQSSAPCECFIFNLHVEMTCKFSSTSSTRREHRLGRLRSRNRGEARGEKARPRETGSSSAGGRRTSPGTPNLHGAVRSKRTRPAVRTRFIPLTPRQSVYSLQNNT